MIAGWPSAVSALTSGVPVEAAPSVRGSIQEYVDERGKTRLPQTYNITMPLRGPDIAAIDLIEGTPVHKDQVVAQIVRSDLDLSVEAGHGRCRSAESVDPRKRRCQRRKHRLEAIAGVRQIDGSHGRGRQGQVESGNAKLDYANSNVERDSQDVSNQNRHAG